MEKLENILKTGGLVLGAGLLGATALGLLGGCYTTQNNLIDNNQKTSVQQSNLRGKQDTRLEYLKTTKESARTRGYLTPEESNIVMGYLMTAKRYDILPSSFIPYAQESKDILIEAIKNDQLPFKAMFYLSLEKKDYDSAELIRVEWANYLSKIRDYSKMFPFEMISKPAIQKKVEVQLKKLNEVGLTDPILINLKRERITAIENKDWDTAQKIQNIMEGRVRELQPTPKPQAVDNNNLGTKTQSTHAQPQQNYPQSNQPITVKVVPSYGAKDLLRAVGLISGKTPSPQETGVSDIIDMIRGLE